MIQTTEPQKTFKTSWILGVSPQEREHLEKLCNDFTASQDRISLIFTTLINDKIPEFKEGGFFKIDILKYE